MRIGGVASGGISGTIRIKADMTAFIAAYNSAKNKSTQTREKEKQVWNSEIEKWKAMSQRERDKAEAKFQRTLRMVQSQLIATWRMIGRVTGLSKNATYQIFTSTITAVAGLVSTAYAAATTYSSIPGGQALALIQMGNAVTNTSLQLGLQIQQVMNQEQFDSIGLIASGGLS